MRQTNLGDGYWYFQGIQITATTPTSSAVRLETGSVELEVSNRVLMATAEAKDKRKCWWQMGKATINSSLIFCLIYMYWCDLRKNGYECKVWCLLMNEVITHQLTRFFNGFIYYFFNIYMYRKNLMIWDVYNERQSNKIEIIIKCIFSFSS